MSESDERRSLRRADGHRSHHDPPAAGRPQRRRRVAAPGAPPAAAAAAAVPTVGANPLLAAAAPVLGGRDPHRRAAATPDPERLGAAWPRRCASSRSARWRPGWTRARLRAARYALCATIDDLVLSTPWGSASSWAAQSLTSIFHNEVTGGERFFDILEQMQKDPGRHGEVVELMYLCASLGFEGRYRVMPRGIAALTELRDGVYRGIRQRRGEFERELSPHWRGIATGYTAARPARAALAAGHRHAGPRPA